MKKEEQLEKYSYRDYIDKVYRENRIIEHIISFCTLFFIITLGSIIAWILNKGNLVGYGIQTVVMGSVFLGVLFGNKRHIKMLIKEDGIKRVRGFIVKEQEEVVYYEVNKEIIKEDKGVRYGIERLNNKKEIVVGLKIIITFLLYGIGIYIIDVGSIEVKYMYQVMLMCLAYLVMFLFYRGDALWNEQDIEEIINKIRIKTGMEKFKEKNTLKVEEGWQNVYLDLYYRKEVLYEKGESIRVKEKYIGEHKRRDEYWEWLREIREFMKNMEMNTNNICVKKREDLR